MAAHSLDLHQRHGEEHQFSLKPALCPPLLNRDSIKHYSMRVIKQSSWLATKITLAFHAAFLFRNLKLQELHFLTGLNNTVGIGKMHVVAVWCIDIAH